MHDCKSLKKCARSNNYFLIVADDYFMSHCCTYASFFPQRTAQTFFSSLITTHFSYSIFVYTYCDYTCLYWAKIKLFVFNSQSLTILATIPAAILILSLFLLLIYLMTRCCCGRKSKKERTFGCQKCVLIFLTILCCGAIGGGLYGNDDLHNGLVQVFNAGKQLNRLFINVRNQVIWERNDKKFLSSSHTSLTLCVTLRLEFQLKSPRTTLSLSFHALRHIISRRHWRIKHRHSKSMTSGRFTCPITPLSPSWWKRLNLLRKIRPMLLTESMLDSISFNHRNLINCSSR